MLFCGIIFRMHAVKVFNASNACSPQYKSRGNVNLIVEPPTEAVNNAFKAVEDAKQGMDTRINEARKYQSEQLPAANANADKADRDAQAYRQQRISEAEGQVSRFNDMYGEYIKYPLITKKRMFYETMEALLPSLKDLKGAYFLGRSVQCSFFALNHSHNNTPAQTGSR